MARVCDRAPCDLLKKALESMAQDPDGKREYDKNSFIELVVAHRSPTKTPFRVTLQYCPFCGTRFTPKWVRAVKEKGSDD